MHVLRAALVLILLTAAPSLAQDIDNASPSGDQDAAASHIESLFAVGATEWMVTAGPAFSIQLFHSAGGYRYALQTVSWGRVLTGPLGYGVLRGRFEWAFEAVPVFGQFTPTRTFGVGLTPLLWRWNFQPRRTFAPFAELAGGALFTRDPVPVRTTRANFTAHVGLGVRMFVRPSQAIVLGYRFHHISNGNRLETNPGINAHVLQVGWTFMPRN